MSVELVDRSDERDWKKCMQQCGPRLARCAGGRIVVDGFVCLHCGSNSPSTDCKEPRRKSRKTKR